MGVVITSQCESGRNEPEVRLCEVRVCRKSLALSSPRTPFLDRATVLVGGDSASVALIGGAIAGALRPDIVNEAWFDVVQTANGDDLVDIAEALAKLRF